MIVEIIISRKILKKNLKPKKDRKYREKMLICKSIFEKEKSWKEQEIEWRKNKPISHRVYFS